jgi:hypothetical protein
MFCKKHQHAFVRVCSECVVEEQRLAHVASNSKLPSSDELLPGSAPFKSHPGFDAPECELREIVVAKTSVTNNGFRCHMTGGHCLPGEHCDSRRQRHALEREEVAKWHR